MDFNNLHNTKKNLAIMFAVIVFILALILEVIFFTFRYINSSFYDYKQFNDVTTEVSKQIKSNPDFFSIFIREGIKFRPPKEGDMKKGLGFGPDRGMKFLSFILIDHKGNIVAQNYNQDIAINMNLLYGLKYNQSESQNGIIFKKIDISGFGDSYKDIIFLKREGYNLNNYFEDILFFFIIDILFSFFFYFIGIYFVGKNLKPVERSLIDMNDFIHNSNHELKTPISVISSNLQLLKTMKEYEDDLVNDSIAEIKRMDELLMGLSQLSNINESQVNEMVVLSDLLNEIIQELKQDITGKNILLEIDIHKNITIQANRQYLYILFSNLLRNAIKYNIDNGKIKIIVDKNLCSISNTGFGIIPEDIPFIFDRFYKGEKGRTSEGFGIGLSLVKKIADIYDWDITLISEQNKETVFTIHF